MTNERLPSLDRCILYCIRSTMSSVPLCQLLLQLYQMDDERLN